MTTPTIKGLAIFVILCYFHLNEVAVASLFNVDPRCNVNNGAVADMNNCSQFILCLQGRVRRVIPCSNGLLYDAERKMCNYRHNVNCGQRPISSPGTDAPCFASDIKVRLQVENFVQRPFFNLQTTVEAPRQSLENFLLLAAGRDNRFRFESQKIDDVGMFVTSFNGVRADSQQLSAWFPFDRLNKEINISIRDYVPGDGDAIVFKFLSFQVQRSGCTGSGCRTVSSRLIGNNG